MTPAPRAILTTGQDVPHRPRPAVRDSCVERERGATRLPSGQRSRLIGAARGPWLDPSMGRPAVDDVIVREAPVFDVENSVTGLIRAWSAGDGAAGDRLFARVYGELRAMAGRLQRPHHAGGDHTLDTTALVHEVYLRLAGTNELRVADRAHFFAIAVRASRQIVSNYARDARTLKRGGELAPLPLDAVAERDLAGVEPDVGLAEQASALEAALVALEAVHPRPCRVVECRYFGGLSIPETALALDISEATVKRDWVVAQAWLHRALRTTEGGNAD